METVLIDWLEALAAGAPTALPAGLDPRLERALAQVRGRLDREIDARRALEAGLERINQALAALARLEFEVSLRPVTGHDEVNAAFAAITMLGEELGYALHTAEGARRDAVDANRTKTVFLANMSHELRTPLNAIIGYGEMVQEEIRFAQVSDPQWDRDLSRMLDAARHLLRLISDILDLSKIEAGHMAFDLQVVSPRDVLREVADAVAPTVAANRSVLTLEGHTARGVRADRLRLVQVLLNLASNAAKFTIGGQVGLTVEDAGSEVVFVVEDTGTGIAAENLGALFTPFVQVHRAIAGIGGTGLGLSIARELCRGMNGDILVTSELGAGSRFEVRLPAA